MSRKLETETVRRLLSSPETHATTLHLIVLMTYGTNALYPEGEEEEWDPGLLFDTLEEDFRVEIPDNLKNKIQALQTALLTDGFFSDSDAFRGMAMGLYDGDVSDAIDGFFDEFSLTEALWAIYEVDINRDEVNELSAGVQRVLAVELVQDAAQGGSDILMMLTVEYLQLLTELEMCGLTRAELETLLPTPFFMQLNDGLPELPTTV